MNDWIKEIASDNYELGLVHLEFSHKGSSYKGQGTLRWTQGAGVQLEAFTDGMESLFQSTMTSGCQPGQLLPDKHYMSMRGTAQDGTIVEISRVCPEGHRSHTGCSTVLWNLSQNAMMSPVVISGKDHLGRDRITKCLLNPLKLRTWPRGSRTTYESGTIREVNGELDWLEFDLGTKARARQLQKDQVLVEWSSESISNQGVLNATRMAFAYLTGQMTNIVACSQFEAGKFTHLLNLPTALIRNRTFLSPLDNLIPGVRWYETFLSMTSQFFATEKGAHFSNLLYACIDSTDNSFTTHALVVCTMLEELIMRTASLPKAERVVSADHKRQIENFLGPISLEPSVTNRILNAIDRMGAKSAKNILHEWAANGFLGIAKEDITAWDDLRNRAAHGRFLMLETAKGQEQFDSLHRVCNLVNKLVLHACGYDGDYFDYVSWAYLRFPNTRQPKN